MANNWNIPKWLEDEVRARDKKCVYCSIESTSTKVSKTLFGRHFQRQFYTLMPACLNTSSKETTVDLPLLRLSMRLSATISSKVSK